jgi:hypothetical protein
MPAVSRAYLVVLPLVALLGACRHSPPSATSRQALDEPRLGFESTPNRELQAIVSPPRGWQVKAPEAGDTSHQVTWVSPSGDTAYGVIYISLPLPVGPDISLLGFMAEMKKDEGESELIAKRFDDALGGLRFVARGTVHTVRGNLITRMFSCWVIYAGTLTEQPINEGELQLAEMAREKTTIGLRTK